MLLLLFRALALDFCAYGEEHGVEYTLVNDAQLCFNNATFIIDGVLVLKW